MKFILLMLCLSQTIRESQSINGLVAGDLNGDRLADLIVQTTDGYSVHLNRGRFRFEAVQHLKGIGVGEPGGVALADVNGDGLLDLVSGSHDSYRIAVLLGDGKGGLRAVANSPFVPRKGGWPHNHSLAVADLNADGLLDIASANIGDGDLSLMLGDGKGGFREAENSPLRMGAGAYRVKVADINRDKIPDLLVASTDERGPDLLVALGLGSGRFELVQDVEQEDHKLRTAQLEITDWDRDGKLDAVVGPGPDGRPMVLLGDGKGRFRRSQKKLPSQGRTWDLLVVKGMILAAAGDHVELISGEEIRRIESGASSWNLALADFDGDGKDDLAVASGVEVSIHSLNGFVDLRGRLETNRHGIDFAKLHDELD